MPTNIATPTKSNPNARLTSKLESCIINEMTFQIQFKSLKNVQSDVNTHFQTPHNFEKIH